MNRRDPAAVILLLIVVVAGLAATATFSVGRAYRSVADPTIGLPSRPAFVSAPDPVLRAENGLDPNSTDEAPGVARPEIRAVQVFPNVINLLEGGVLTRSIPLASPVTTPIEIRDVIADDDWISSSTPTELVVNAAVLMQPGTTLNVGAPLRRVVLQARQGIFVGGKEATLIFDGVEVEASDRAVPRDGEVGPGSRPFILAEGGRMEVRDSTFRYLGRDWNGSYGVSWTKGATGYAVDSTFEQGFMGVFAATAIDVSFSRNTFRANSLYGINAHTLSAGLLVDGNTAERNGRDGILLSDTVTDAVIRNNHSHHNGGNAIMLDTDSNGNLIENNIAESNIGDGIVVSGSSGNRILDNTVRDNRVAIGIFGETDGDNVANGNVATGNVIDENGLATQGISATGNAVLSNGDYWRPTVLVLIWVIAAVLVWVLVLLTRVSRRHRDNTIARSNSERQLLRSGVGQ